MKIAFATDFHSSFLNGAGMINFLYQAKAHGALVLDSGDFLAESAYAHVAGHVEAASVMNELFDALCPGNHGFPEACESPKSICCNLHASDGLICRPYLQFDTADGCLAVIGVMGEEAFAATPLAQRAHLTLEPPHKAIAETLAKLPAHVDHVVLLSHCGFAFDEVLASAFPQLRAIISGHCHSNRYHSRIAGVAIVKAPEMGRGAGVIEINSAGELTQVALHSSLEGIPAPGSVAARALLASSACVEEELSAVIGRQTGRFRAKLADRRQYLVQVVAGIADEFPGETVALNEFVFRHLPPDEEIDVGGLLEFIPFDNCLVRVPAASRQLIQDRLGRADNVISSQKIERSDSIITTEYLFENLSGVAYRGPMLPKLRDVVLRVLTEAAPRHSS